MHKIIKTIKGGTNKLLNIILMLIHILIICISLFFLFKSLLDDAIVFNKCRSLNLNRESKLTNLELTKDQICPIQIETKFHLKDNIV